MTDRLVRIGRVWVRASSLDAIEPTNLSKARIHLRGGTTIDVAPMNVPIDEFIDNAALRIAGEETP